MRDWNRTELVEQWRERWADHVNQRLAELDIDARVDHRSLEAQDIAFEPRDKIGPAASRMEWRGLEAERIEQHREIAERNGELIIANPRVALDAITYGHTSTLMSERNRDEQGGSHRADTEERIIGLLKEAEASAVVTELRGRHGISSTTYYAWKAKLGGLEVSDARRLRALEEENARLKRPLADTMLNNAGLKNLLSKK